MPKASFFGKPKRFYSLTWQYIAAGCKTQQRKIRSFLGEVLLHPRYSLDKSSADFHLLRYLEHFIYGKTFIDKDDKISLLNFFLCSLNGEWKVYLPAGYYWLKMKVFRFLINNI